MMTRVFGWSADDTDGCGYYRIRLPLDELARRGHYTSHSTALPTSLWAEGGSPEFDVVVGQRVSKPGPTEVWQKMARQGKVALVYELDDDLFSIPPSNTRAHGFFRLPEIRDNIIRNLRVAHAATVSTDALAAVARQYNPNVHVLRNCIPASIIKPRTRDWPEPPLIGWTGSSTHSEDFAVMGDALAMVLHTTTSRVEFGGHDYTKEAGLAGYESRVQQRLWLPIEDHYRSLRRYSLGVCPLADTVFNRSKSHIKPLELMAVGVPVVASYTPEYGRLCVNGATVGGTTETPFEWYQAICASLEGGTREQLVSAGQQQASKHTIEGNIYKWEEVYRSVQ